MVDNMIGDVVVYNERASQTNGELRLTDPTGSVRVNEPFEVVSPSAADDDENMAPFKNVWTTDGSYEVSLELTKTDIDGADSMIETVSVANPEKEMLIVRLSADGPGDPINFCVQNNFEPISKA
ncbi:MAG: hypothetical protein J07HX5_01200 [halophilic archaeon J07HX5]|jgi:hypothetical protein|nr:MAG: hypothetical protein J07HX5_01200 [halophilic archaeon J07HX5]